MNIAIKWDTLADNWCDAGPPAAPSKGDLSIYRKYLAIASKGSHPRILMLGCTFKLRLLIAQMQIPVTCVDISNKMLEKTSLMLKGRNTNEKLVCQDWLQMNLGRNRFSAAVGDKILDNVRYANWLGLKERILRHLVPSGWVITRVAPQDTSLIGKPFSDILRSWGQLAAKHSIPYKIAASGLWEQALGASARSVPGKQSISYLKREIEDIKKRGTGLSNAEKLVFEKFCQIFWRNRRWEWTSYTLGNVIDTFGEELALIALGRSKDYTVSIRQPILLFRDIRRFIFR